MELSIAEFEVEVDRFRAQQQRVDGVREQGGDVLDLGSEFFGREGHLVVLGQGGIW